MYLLANFVMMPMDLLGKGCNNKKSSKKSGSSGGHSWSSGGWSDDGHTWNGGDWGSDGHDGTWSDDGYHGDTWKAAGATDSSYMDSSLVEGSNNGSWAFVAAAVAVLVAIGAAGFAAKKVR